MAISVKELIDYSKKEMLMFDFINNLSIEEQYEYLSSQLEYITLKDLKKLNMNIKTKEELSNLTSLDKLYIPFLKKAKLYGKTNKGANTLFSVLNLLCSICLESTSGMCYPSMLTMAFMIEPSLETVLETDSFVEKKRKNNAISKVKIKISRAVRELENMGLIKTLNYYTTEKHYHNQKKLPSFAYHIVPISISLCIKVVLKNKIVYKKGVGMFVQSLIDLTKNIHTCIIKEMQYFSQYKILKKDVYYDRI